VNSPFVVFHRRYSGSKPRLGCQVCRRVDARRQGQTRKAISCHYITH
jgi:hypothetical protein